MQPASLDLLEVSTVPLDDPGALLALLPPVGGLAWTQGADGLVGWGEAARVVLDGPDPFLQGQTWWDELVLRAHVSDPVGLPGSGLVAFGSFAFDSQESTSVLVVPAVLVGTHEGRSWVTTIGPGDGPRPQIAPASPVGVTFTDGTCTGEQWKGIVAEAVTRIESGLVEKVVLARDVVATATEPIDVRWLLGRLAQDYPSCWTFAVDGLLGATPEMLVRLRDGTATSRVLAGTLRRSGDANQDLRQTEVFTRSIKDIEEHGYGVRSVADALAPHCSEVDVPTSPFVLELANLMHLATDVTGVVKDGSSSLQLLASLHPSAAICGTPTPVALALIREIEGLPRGRYSGPVGWMDASGDGEWGIALRCGAVDPADPRTIRLFAGCGIVSGSEPDRELAESNAKLLPMRGALSSS